MIYFSYLLDSCLSFRETSIHIDVSTEHGFVIKQMFFFPPCGWMPVQVDVKTCGPNINGATVLFGLQKIIPIYTRNH